MECGSRGTSGVERSTGAGVLWFRKDQLGVGVTRTRSGQDQMAERSIVFFDNVYKYMIRLYCYFILHVTLFCTLLYFECYLLSSACWKVYREMGHCILINKWIADSRNTVQ